MPSSQVAGLVSQGSVHVCVCMCARVCVNAHMQCSINSSGDRPLMLRLLLNPKAEGGGHVEGWGTSTSNTGGGEISSWL